MHTNCTLFLLVCNWEITYSWVKRTVLFDLDGLRQRDVGNFFLLWLSNWAEDWRLVLFFTHVQLLCPCLLLGILKIQLPIEAPKEEYQFREVMFCSLLSQLMGNAHNSWGSSYLMTVNTSPSTSGRRLELCRSESFRFDRIDFTDSRNWSRCRWTWKSFKEMSASYVSDLRFSFLSSLSQCFSLNCTNARSTEVRTRTYYVVPPEYHLKTPRQPINRHVVSFARPQTELIHFYANNEFNVWPYRA